MKHLFVKRYNSLCIILLIIVSSITCLAQAADGNVKDPLKKPDLWAKLEANPVDSALWVAYYGKEWKAMAKDDFEKITFWKQHLMLNILAKNESVLGFVIKPKDDDDDFFIDDDAFKEIIHSIKGGDTSSSSPKVTTKKINKAQMRKELDGIESIILGENKKLQELKKNVRANFSVIEDVYKNIFHEFNMDYVYYKVKYPNGNYPEMKWVEDQEKKLQKLKQDQIEELRKKYTVK
ncbi:MAG: hypothetical protein EAZ08_04630 [Cytophagales bacterium]|nr:MAG: hypothetical protein EAZ08_04630 [Cytophagales bacterium]